ncbi:MAG: dUTP diphosphatase [Geminicoccaceae bacterium]
MKVAVPIECLPHGQGLPLPAYASEGAAGLDLLAAVPADEPLRMAPGTRALVPTGVRIALPEGFEGQVRPRSGLALRLGLTVLNAPGTIDRDYRGEIGVVLVNHGEETAVITRGMRVAQLVVAPVAHVAWETDTGSLSASARGVRGFGSTGTAPRIAEEESR